MTALRSKKDIVENWLTRYTGLELEEFGQYILLTNFANYLDLFCELNQTRITGKNKPMPCATAGGITIINFGMGSANAATIMDLLSAIHPAAVLFLGKCGGIKKKNKLPPAFDFLLGLRITATSTGKSIHTPAGPHFFPACALILIASGF